MGYFAPSDLILPAIALAMISFAVLYDYLLDFPWLGVLTLVFVVMLATGALVSGWGHTADALASMPPTGDVRLCGRARGTGGIPCHLEAPPLRVIYSLFVGLAVSFVVPFYCHADNPLRRAIIATLLMPIVPGILALGYSHIHPTWFYDPILIAATALALTLLPEAPRLARRLVAQTRAEIADVVPQGPVSLRSEARQTVLALAGLIGSGIGALRSAIRRLCN